MSQEMEMTLRLLVAATLGFVIGLQREWKEKPAGVRTLTLISVGSALFAIISEMGFIGGDPSRIAAGIVTGIGFLGAGAILHRQGGVEGQTTAAAIWATAGIGLAVGAGLYLIAIVVAAITVGGTFPPSYANIEKSKIIFQKIPF
ncbi:MAG: MgtC/SapB family protein [Thermodesulfobacteriota bacterium]|jgi:putative Mg2+ transporter-C (MgtC) family protein